MEAQHCYTFAMFGEPLAETTQHGDIPPHGRGLRPSGAEVQNLVPPDARPHQGEAWNKARKIPANLKATPLHPRGQDQSGKRVVDLAARGDIHGERLWMPVAALSGGKGNSCLVGTAEQVAEAKLKYYRFSVNTIALASARS